MVLEDKGWVGAGMALKANQTLAAFDFLLISPMSQRRVWHSVVLLY